MYGGPRREPLSERARSEENGSENDDTGSLYANHRAKISRAGKRKDGLQRWQHSKKRGPPVIETALQSPSRSGLGYGETPMKADSGTERRRDGPSKVQQDSQVQEQIALKTQVVSRNGGDRTVLNLSEEVSTKDRTPPGSEEESVGAGMGKNVDGPGSPGEGSVAQTKTPSFVPIQYGDKLSVGTGGGLEGLELDIRELLRSLPTKSDIQELISAVEQSCQQAVENLREDTRAMGHRVESLENSHEAVVQAVADIQDTVKQHEEALNFYRDQLDDYENRDCRQNIPIKGLPETIRSPELLPTVQRLFRQIMGDSSPENIEVDRVHRVPPNVTPNSEKPRDTICK